MTHSRLVGAEVHRLCGKASDSQTDRFYKAPVDSNLHCKSSLFLELGYADMQTYFIQLLGKKAYGT